MNKYNNLNDKEKAFIDSFLNGNFTHKSLCKSLGWKTSTVYYYFQRLKKKHDVNTREDLFKLFFQERNRYFIKNILLTFKNYTF